MCAVMAGGCTHIKTFVFGARPAGHHCADYMPEMQENVPLAPLTTLRAGGRARYFFVARTEVDIAEAAGFARAQNLPLLVLGGGSNMLVSDSGFSGVIIKNEIRGIVYEQSKDKVRVIAGAGENWDDLVCDTVERNLYGLENLSLIPGTVGAAPVQNIGAYGTEAEKYIEWVEVFDTDTTETKQFSNADCVFSYRQSLFKREEYKNYIITRVSFLLCKNGELNTAYKDVTEYFAENSISPVTLKSVRDAIVAIRMRKLPMAGDVGTAGSFFENPIVSVAEKDALLESYPGLVWYPFSGDGVKISAAWLIDHIGGWKGKRIGNVGVHERQALVLVNYSSGNTREIYDLAENIRRDIREKTGILFEYEVNLVGDF